MEHEIEEFAKLAQEEFGDKVIYCTLEPNQETIDKINKDYKAHLSIEDFRNYGKHVWLMEPKCPRCNENLLGIFGAFIWNIRFGEGNCSSCGETTFRYYHRFDNLEKPIEGFELIGF